MLLSILPNYVNSASTAIAVLVLYFITGDEGVLVCYMLVYPISNIFDGITKFFNVLAYNNQLRRGTDIMSTHGKSIVFSAMITLCSVIVVLSCLSYVLYCHFLDEINAFLGYYIVSNTVLYYILNNMSYYLMFVTLRVYNIFDNSSKITLVIFTGVNVFYVVILGILVKIVSYEFGSLVSVIYRLVATCFLLVYTLRKHDIKGFCLDFLKGASFACSELVSSVQIVTSITAIVSNALLSAEYLVGVSLVYLVQDPAWDALCVAEAVYIKSASNTGNSITSYIGSIKRSFLPTAIICLIQAVLLYITGTVKELGIVVSCVEVFIVSIQSALFVSYAYWQTRATRLSLFIYNVYTVTLVPMFAFLFRFPFSNDIGYAVRDASLLIFLLVSIYIGRHKYVQLVLLCEYHETLRCMGNR